MQNMNMKLISNLRKYEGIYFKDVKDEPTYSF